MPRTTKGTNIDSIYFAKPDKNKIYFCPKCCSMHIVVTKDNNKISIKCSRCGHFEIREVLTSE